MTGVRGDPPSGDPESDFERRLVSGQYQIEGPLGSGAMGVVVRARQLSLNRVVALKLLKPLESHSLREQERFIREARVLTSLRHPNLVSVYDAEPTGPEPYIAMELVEGPSLASYLELPDRYPRPDGLRVARGLASALAYIHQRGIIHRDIKPANVLLRTPEHALLADFGLARPQDAPSLTATGYVVGTPAYLAPEQFVQGGFSKQSDIYQLGLVLYELLTGRFLVTTNDPELRSVLAQRLGGTLPDLSSAAPEYSRDFSGLVMRCLSKDPGDRPADGDALFELLQSISSASAATAVPVEAPAKTQRISRRSAAATPRSSKPRDPGPRLSRPRTSLIVLFSATGAALLAGFWITRVAGREVRLLPALTPTEAITPTPDVRLELIEFSRDASTSMLTVRWKASHRVLCGHRLAGEESRHDDPRSTGDAKFSHEPDRPFSVALLRSDGGESFTITDKDLSAFARDAGSRLTRTLREFWTRSELSDQAFVDLLVQKLGSRGIPQDERGRAVERMKTFLDSLGLLEPLKQFFRIAEVYFALESIPVVEKLELYRYFSPVELADSVATEYGLESPFGVELSSLTGDLFEQLQEPKIAGKKNHVLHACDEDRLVGSTRQLNLGPPSSDSRPILVSAYKLEASAIPKVTLAGFPIYFSKAGSIPRVEAYKLHADWRNCGGPADFDLAVYKTHVLGHTIPSALVKRGPLPVEISLVWIHRPKFFENNRIWFVWLASNGSSPDQPEVATPKD